MFGLFRSASQPSRRSRLAVESLEDRSVPAVFTVTNLSDHNPGSLREAIQNANARLGTDTIQFAPLLTGTITLTTGDLDITDDVEIQGPGANRIAVSGNRDFRIFDLDPAVGRINVSISGLKLTRGAAIDAVDGDDGGAIRAADAELTLRSCVVSGNSAEGRSAVSSDEGKVTVVNCIFANNIASGGGALYVNDGRLVARNSQFLNNTTFADDSDGGALYLSDSTVLVKDCVISGNSCDNDGGGIYSDGGSLTLVRTTLTNNTAEYGGGISMFDGGRLTVRSSTISFNRANGSADNNYGGAGAFLFEVEAVIVNCTISGNVDQSETVDVTTGGGGLHLYGGNTVIRNSTIALNSTVGKGGGIFLRDSDDQIGRLMLASTIVSNSTAPGGNFDVFRDPGTGKVTAVFSLIQRIQPGFINMGSTANLIGVNPMLLPLADNGGPTQTHAITSGSPARNAGSNPDQLKYDQRGLGFPRVKDGGVDIGAFEL